MAKIEEYPQYLEALETGDERVARARIHELEAEIQALEKTLVDSRRAKRILYLKDAELEHEVVRFMVEELKLPVRAPQGNGGGFWVGRGSEPAWCMGEVVSVESGNVTKEHLAQVMVHRARAGKPDASPALLVANTFENGQAMEERDQPVSPEVVRRAVEDHIVVVRTLDLVRLWHRASNGFPAAEQLAEALESGGGWFEVDATFNARVYRAEGSRSPAPQVSHGTVTATIPPPAAAAETPGPVHAPKRPDATQPSPTPHA
jgi:hypothetical protein